MVTKIKLIRALQKRKQNLKFDLSVTRINGVVKGCSGFITNPDNGLIVYVNTEDFVLSNLSNKILVRYALSTKDYSGGLNNFVDTKDYPDEIIKMLSQPERASREVKIR